MPTHDDWEQARTTRDRLAVSCTRAQLAGRRDDVARYAAEFALVDAEMARLERVLDGA